MYWSRRSKIVSIRFLSECHDKSIVVDGSLLVWNIREMIYCSGQTENIEMDSCGFHHSTPHTDLCQKVSTSQRTHLS